MHEFKVDCVCFAKTGRNHEHLTHIGNIAGKWRFTVEDAITQIQMKTSGFYTLEKSTGLRMPIGIVRVKDKPPYLRTYADGQWNDNLLLQPDCGACQTY